MTNIIIIKYDVMVSHAVTFTAIVSLRYVVILGFIAYDTKIGIMLIQMGKY